MGDTTFDWVRHAESVANWANNKPSDSYTDSGATEKLKEEIQKFQALEYLNLQEMKKSKNFPLINKVYDIIEKDYKNLNSDDNQTLRNNCQIPDYEGIPQTAEEIINSTDLTKIQEIWNLGKIDLVNNGCIEELKKLRKEIDPKNNNIDAVRNMRKYAYWLRNMITTNFLFQPTLTYVGMLQAKNLGEKLGETSEEKSEDDTPPQVEYDLVISSPTVRTLMTGYIALLHCGDAVKDKTITIVPYTNEKENETEVVLYGKGLHDFTNAAMHPLVINDVCNEIKKYLDDKYKDLANKSTVTFNTAEYINYCEDKSEEKIDDIRRCNIKKFWDYVNVAGNTIFKDKKNVLSFCHGYAIDEVRKSAKVDISAIYDESCNSNKNNSAKFRSFGANTSIFRHKYKDGGVIPNMYTDKDYKNIQCDDDEIKEVMENSLKAIGVVYIPEKIREKAFKDADKVTLEDDLMGLREGSLRYNIAKFTHGKIINDATEEEYCTNNGYYRLIKGDKKWLKLDSNIDSTNFKNCKEYTDEISSVDVGGRRTRRRKGKKTHRAKKGKKGKKTRRGKIGKKSKKTRRGKNTKKHY